MKAIQTVYKGYKFRSRLEARWAVFFDALEWNWQYEVEGFELEGGIKYLPDFYLPQINTWIEVKPDIYTAEEYEKCRLFSKGLKEEHFIALVTGLPTPTSFICFHQGEECSEISLTQYARQKCWDVPYFGSLWIDEDMPAFDAAKSARFEYGEIPKF